MNNTDEQVSAETFVDNLLYIDGPVDPKGDKRSPHAEWAEKRKTSKIEVETDRFGEGMGTLVYLYAHKDVLACLHNNEVFSSSIIQHMFTNIMGSHVLVGMDEPAHSDYRNLVAPALRPKLLAKWEESLINAVIDEIIDNIKPKGKADLVADFTFAFPARVVGQIIGLPQDNFDQFQRWAISILEGIVNEEEAAKSAKEVKEYIAPFLEARRIDPRDDMISELAHAEIDGKHLTEDEIYSFLLLLLPAGIETTYRALGSMLFHLLSNPDQLDAVRKDRSLVSKAIEETLRFDPPIPYPPRIAMVDTELDGQKIAAGSVVVPLLSAANRDPLFVGEDPESFNLLRPSIKHVTFGNGVHTCIGLHLARMELKMALNKILDALPNIRIDEEEFKRVDAHIRGITFRSPTALPVVWDI